MNIPKIWDKPKVGCRLNSEYERVKFKYALGRKGADQQLFFEKCVLRALKEPEFIVEMMGYGNGPF